jgi:ribonuclease T2
MANKGVRCLIISIAAGLVVLVAIGVIVYLVSRGQRSTIKQDAHPQPNKNVTFFGAHPQPNRNVTFFGAFPRLNLNEAGSDSCPRPDHFRTDYDYTSKDNDRVTTSPVNFFRLTLSWSPTFCDGRSDRDEQFQCKASFGFIVHGLWPNSFKGNPHPRNCRDAEKIPLDLIQRYFCMMPSEYLLQSEWAKHGTCYWDTPDEYFERMKNLYSNIQIPKDIKDIIYDNTLSKRDLIKGIKRSFIINNPGLNRNNTYVGLQGRKLKEVAFCYDLDFNYTGCNQ